MLRITVDLIKASSGEVETLGVAEIVNDDTGSLTYGNYKYTFLGKSKIIKTGRLKGFRRRSSVWWLVFYCLRLSFWENKKVGELWSNGNPQSFRVIE